MSLEKINTRTLILILMIVAATAMRFVSYEYKWMSNFSPVGAIAMFGGVYFTDKWKAYVVVLLSLYASDVVINHFYTNSWIFFTGDTFWNCVCFCMMVFIGSRIKNLNIVSSLIILLAPVTIHWLIMDMPWINDAGGLYPKTLAGYGAALIAAIPFEKNMLLGDAVFGLILFGGFELAKKKYGALRNRTELAL
ncbi:DUF6580 family putative transport protein [Mucilaginibacter calamicampi]|uniref:DUF6580 family putative transport protein n=1 Tax=Mucilaginibacter calamicampi TaxID=1302352 RepID=A0ABW2YTB3_9SPHI